MKNSTKIFSLIIFTLYSFTLSSQNPQGHIATNWHQEGIYDDFSPSCTNERTPPGCGAVALGQILNYYAHPNIAISYIGVESLFCPNSAPVFTGTSGNQIIMGGNQSVGEFLYNLGTIIRSEFRIVGDGGTYLRFRGNFVDGVYQFGSSHLENIMSTYLDYDNINILLKNNMPQGVDFENAIRSELSNCKPVLLLGYNSGSLFFKEGGHWMVIDDYDPVIDKFHINWGWKSEMNGYYKLNELSKFLSYNYSENQIAIINIKPAGLNDVDVCNYVSNVIANNQRPYNFKKNTNFSVNKSFSLSCPVVNYPDLSNPILSNRIQIDWNEIVNASGYYVQLTDVTNNEILYPYQPTYGGFSAFEVNNYYPPNATIEVLIEPFDSNGNILTCTPFSFQSAPENCSVNLDYVNAYCIDNGSKYMVEVEFSGENVTYDLFADWDMTNYDSENSVSPGYYLLGPFNINQNLGIVVEDESNPFNCFDSELVVLPINLGNCISTSPPPTTATIQASNMNPNLITNNSLQANWIRGSGDNVIVTCTPCAKSISVPQDGVSYSYDNNFSQSPTIGNSRVVYKGTNSSRFIFDLTPNTCYILSAYEFTGSGNNTLYQIIDPAEASATTLDNLSLDFDWDPFVIVEDVPIDFDWISSLGGLSIEEWAFEGGNPPVDNGNGDNIYFDDPGIFEVTLNGYHASTNQWESVSKDIEVLSADEFAPDFTFAHSDLNQIEVVPGGDLDIDWIVGNNGIDLGQVTWMNYYLSTNNVLDSTDTQFPFVPDDFQGDILGGGEVVSGSRTVSTNNNINNGSYFVIVEIKSEAPTNSGSAELDTTNNFVAIPFDVVSLLPDLTIQNVILSSNILASGQTFDATITYANIGNGICCTGSNIQIKHNAYLSIDSIWSPDDGDRWQGLEIDGAKNSFSDILIENPGQTFTEIDPITTQDIAPTGSYYLIFVIDRDDEIIESDESNNVFVVPITISNPNQPAIQASDLHLVSKTGSSVTLGWTGGDGDGTILMAQKETNQGNPIDGDVYVADSFWPNAGKWTHPNGDIVDYLRIVYEGSGNQVTISGLGPDTTWYFSLYEFKGSGNNIDYLQAGNEFLAVHLPAAGNQNSELYTTYKDGEINNLEIDINDLLVTSNEIYAFGFRGFFLKSTDSGASYELIRLADGDLNVTDAELVNDHLVCMDNEIVYISNDAGDSWQTSTVGANIDREYSLFMLNDSIHLGSFRDINSNYHIHRTIDGGENWGSVHSSSYRLNDIALHPNGTIWACGENGELINSFNNGISWSPAINNKPTTDAYIQIQFLTNEIGYIRTTMNLYKTIDGGSNWNLMSAINGNLFNSMVWLNEDHGFLLEGSNLIRKTTDGGVSWSTYLDTGPTGFNRCLTLGEDADVWVGGTINLSSFEGCTLNTYYVDNDNDGFGASTSTVESCTLPVGYADNDLDCNDNNPLYNPNNQACPVCVINTLSVNDVPINNGAYHSEVELNSNGIVDPNSNVIFKSDVNIKLTDGFKANQYFKATIDGCPE